MSRRINILFSFILLIFISNIANANCVLFKDSVGVQIETDLLKLEIQIVKPNIAKLSYRLPDESYGEPTVSMNYSSKKNRSMLSKGSPSSIQRCIEAKYCLKKKVTGKGKGKPCEDQGWLPTNFPIKGELCELWPGVFKRSAA